MINVTKLGTLGNNMWQYSVSRVIAEKNNLQLNCYSIPGFPRTEDVVSGNSYGSPLVNIEGHFFDKELSFANSRVEMKENLRGVDISFCPPSFFCRVFKLGPRHSCPN